MSTAEVAIVVTGIVGLGSPALAAWREARREEVRFRRDRTSKEIDELRSTLVRADEAITQFIQAAAALSTKLTLVHPKSPAEAMRHSFYTQELDAYAPAKKGADDANRLLVILLGRDHGVVKAFERVMTVLDSTGTDAGIRIMERDAGKEKEEDWLKFVASAQSRAREWNEAHERFLDAATALVGADVGPAAPRVSRLRRFTRRAKG
jgi:hypothetical protein